MTMTRYVPALFFLLPFLANGQQRKFSARDTLFGSNTVERRWWDVLRYDVNVTPDYNTKTITGSVDIRFRVLSFSHSPMQIDLQRPMEIDAVFFDNKPISLTSNLSKSGTGENYFLRLPQVTANSVHSVAVRYHGKPREATNAPWDGGWVWTKDKQGRPWMSVACEGDGASIWFPCKDSWTDEPDSGASLTVTVPPDLVAVGNGRLRTQKTENGKKVFTWEVTQPINAYNIIPYIGHYTSWSDTLNGENGRLDLGYWVLDYEEEKARKQFEQAKPTLRAFEHWFGPYPFYPDGYKLVQSPYLGMEHQSAVAYGNEFRNGYLGTDLSRTGWGLKWDYIIVHETGHEWFGNNITAKDRADMWVHEGFTDYSETLFLDYFFGRKAGDEYTQGLRNAIQNDKPIIAAYGVNQEGSGDMYFKGANVLHTIRQVMKDDGRFRQILRGLNKHFRHQTVTSKQIENYISAKSGIDFSKVFDQYLRTTKVPVLEWKQSGSTVFYRWSNVVPGFSLPVRLTNGQWLKPTERWQVGKTGGSLRPDNNFYISTKRVS